MPVKTVQIQVTALTDKANRDIAATSAYFEKLRKANPVELQVKLDKAQALAESRILAREMSQTVRDTVKLDTSGIGDKLQKLADSMRKGGGPWWLGPGLLGLGSIATLAGTASAAVIGLGGAFVAGAGALAAFGAVAKPVLSGALKAAQAVNTAQNNYTVAIANGVKPAVAWRREQIAIGKAYADMSPQQIRLSQQLGNMAQAWQNVKAAFTPIVAGSLQPWLKGITTGIGTLGSVIKPMGPIITQLGTEFGILMSSQAFKDFMKFLGTTGSAVVQSAGSAIINVITGFITLLPKFSPLILDAAFGISKWSNAFLTWASSKKASDQIKSFLEWVHDNGPMVKTLLQNLGGALKALAPGLASGGVLELKLLSDFLGFIARLPRKVAAPLAEIAGALLLLNKLGVVSVGFRLLFPPGAAGAAAGGAAATGLWSRMLPGVRLIAGALVATVVVAMVLKSVSSGPGGKNWWDNPGGADPTSKDPNKQGVSTWVGLGHQIEKIWGDVWISAKAQTVSGWHRITEAMSRGNAETNRLISGWEHDVAHWFDIARHDMAAAWNRAWNDTIGATTRGIASVMLWIGTVPGRIGNIFKGAGTWLLQFGKNTLTGFLNGVKSVWHDVTSWFSGLPSAILHALGIHSPPDWAISAGKHVMGGLLKGIAHGAGDVRAFFVGLAGDVLGPLKSIWNRLGGLGGTPGAGVARWAPLVSKALALLGEPQNLMGRVLFQMQTESGGNPRAINLTDINAQLGQPSQGLMQVIPPTFARYAGPFLSRGIYDPLANIYAAINYAMHTYGSSLMNSAGQGIGSGHGYRLGGLITEPILGMGSSGTAYAFHAGETVKPGYGGGDMRRVEALLDEQNDLLSQLIGVAAAAPARTGAGIGAALAMGSRSAVYSSLYP